MPFLFIGAICSDMKYSKHLLSILLLLLVPMTALTHEDANGHPVATVNHYTITDKNIDIRLKAEQTLGRSNITPQLALSQIIDELLMHIVLSKYNLTATADETKNLVAIIESKPEFKNAFVKIKTLYKDNQRLYEDSFINPLIHKDKLVNFYNSNRDFHLYPFEKINSTLKSTKHGISFKKASKKFNLTYSTENFDNPQLISKSSKYSLLLEPKTNLLHNLFQTQLRVM